MRDRRAHHAAFAAQRAARDPAASADAEQIRAAAEQGVVQPAGARQASAVQTAGRLGNPASPAARAINGAASTIIAAIDLVLRG